MEIFRLLNRIFSVYTILFTIFIGITSLLFDARKTKENKDRKTYRMIQFVSIAYIFIGIISTVFIKIIRW